MIITTTATTITATQKFCAVCLKPMKMKPSTLAKRRTCSKACQRQESVSSRFWSKVTKTVACWLWVGRRDKHGYGSFQPGGRGSLPVRAHRFSFMEEHGNISPDINVLHKCDNPSCVRPDHLFTGSHADNVADKIRKGRQTRGESSGRAKLTAEDVQAIRLLGGRASNQNIAKQYGVSKYAVWSILNGKTWRHVP